MKKKFKEEVFRDYYDSNEDYNEGIGTLEATGCSCIQLQKIAKTQID